MTDTVADLAALLADASRVVAFTGAGVSTESGIPDFRSPTGVWTRYDPTDFTFDRYVGSAEVRANAWAMRREFFALDPQPNAAHRAIADLESEGREVAVVTQNIDGLHQAAGSTQVLELHGTARSVMCIGFLPVAGTPDGCGWESSVEWALAQVDAGVGDPRCPRCSGIVKSSTVSFGQVLADGVVDRMHALLAWCDVLLTVGSSLQVYPAASMPALARYYGARLAIVNDEPTPCDELAHLVVRGRAGEVLPAAVS